MCRILTALRHADSDVVGTCIGLTLVLRHSVIPEDFQAVFDIQNCVSLLCWFFKNPMLIIPRCVGQWPVLLHHALVSRLYS